MDNKDFKQSLTEQKKTHNESLTAYEKLYLDKYVADNKSIMGKEYIMPRPKKEAPNRSDNRFEVKITIGKALDGKLIRKSFYSSVSKSDAINKAEEWKIKKEAFCLSGKTYVDNKMIFSEWAYLWLEKYKLGTVKESTYLESYKRTVDNYLIPYFGNIKLVSIKPIDVKSFFQLYCDKYHETTLKKMKLCLNAIFETAIENDLCYKNPCKNINVVSNKESIARRTILQEEVGEILKYSLSHKYGLYIWILLELGLRCSELCGLKWSDFNIKNKTVNISRACTESNGKTVVGKTKNKSSNRVLPISTELAEQVKEKILSVESLDIFVITSNRKKDNVNPLSPSKFTESRYNTFFNDYNAEKRVTPHELRHTCGTLLYARTKDIYAVSKFLGHSNVNITAKLYVHDNPEMLRDALKIN